MAEPARQFTPPTAQANWKTQLDLERAMALNQQAARDEEAEAGGGGRGNADASSESGIRERIQEEEAAAEADENPAASSDPVVRAKARAAARSGAGSSGGQSIEAAAAEALASGELPTGPAAYKMAINKFVWPLVLDPTGIVVGIEALTFLQFYWVSSMLDTPGTVKMELWEHIALFCLSLLEIVVISIFAVGVFVASCTFLPGCYTMIAFQGILSAIGL